MRFGMILPGGTAVEQLEQAVLAEESGWDGVFVWEAAYGVDAWGLLSAIAARTATVTLGTALTPLPWRRPWKVASQVVTLDQISGGRAVLMVGLGATTTDLPDTGEEQDLRTRAAMMDEGIDLVRDLWRGASHYRGEHYTYDVDRTDLAEVAVPVQRPIPVWVVGLWPRPKSMRRALRCDGVMPQYAEEASPARMREMCDWLGEHGAPPGYDVLAEGETPADDPDAASAEVARWAEAGATWWLETRWDMPHHSPERLRQVRERLAAGPPRVA
jgi:alkanesulfonate monooxygenase SsuD/methylene tetrahydromethanopterin reductase-like flavin-dependent oxidoreductase (luciferase family)